MTETWPEIKRRQQDERCAAVTEAIAACGGNQTEAAKLLKMARGSLDRMVREYGLVGPKPAKQRREDWHNVK
jgi:transcriptional regulator of acetoin/glycerol metabolism